MRELNCLHYLGFNIFLHPQAIMRAVIFFTHCNSDPLTPTFQVFGTEFTTKPFCTSLSTLSLWLSAEGEEHDFRELWKYPDFKNFCVFREVKGTV